MKQAEFEALASGTVSALLGIRDKETLLLHARRLLDADVAALFSRNTGGNKASLLAIIPPDVEKDIASLRAWYEEREVPQSLHGFTRGKPIEAGGRTFTDALVAFGERLSGAGLPSHELLVLKEKSCRNDRAKPYYSSHHCWAASQLLRHFEQVELQNLLLEQETHAKEQYSETLTKEVLPDEPWNAIKRRIKKLAEQGYDPKFMWTIYLIWVAYQTRKIRAGKTPAEGFKEHFSDPEREEFFSGLAHIESTTFRPLFDLALEIFVSNDEEMIPNAKLREVLCRNIDRFCLPSSRDAGKEQASKSDVPEEKRWFSQVTALILEHAWGKILRTATRLKKGSTNEGKTKGRTGSERSGLKFSEVINDVKELVELTRAVVIQALTSLPIRSLGKHEKIKLTEIGRESLRLYFAQEVTRPDSRIEQLYLGGEKRKVRREAPMGLQLAFIVQLSRFMLSVVAILEGRLRIRTSATDTMPPVIRPGEALDSLLYLVDRMAHVELEVDERLNIQNHLARQVPSEVHQYLNRPRYRDHLLHVIDVFLLGYLLLNAEVPWIKGRKHPWVKHLCQRTGRKGSMSSIPYLKEDWLRNWAVAALLHDIGYQLGDGKSIAQTPWVWKAYFELPAPKSPLWFHLPKRADKDSSSPDPLESVRKLAENLKGVSGFEDCFPDLDRVDKKIIRDHGILSALRVAQVLAHAQGGAGNKSKARDNLVARYQLAIQAIAHHNLADETVDFNTNSLACLLRLCDELQEWDRRRVNMEKILKGLYLDITEGQLNAFPAHQMIDTFEANLKFEPQNEEANQSRSATSVKIRVQGDGPNFVFRLFYRNPVDGHFDPAMTALCKAYTLQHMDLDVSSKGTNDLHFRIAMYFPLPSEYGSRSEYDIYALFTEDERSLPLLREFSSLEHAEPGLVHLKDTPEGQEKVDAFGIVLTRAADQEHHYGWLPVNPTHFFDKYLEFKKWLLAGGGE